MSNLGKFLNNCSSESLNDGWGFLAWLATGINVFMSVFLIVSCFAYIPKSAIVSFAAIWIISLFFALKGTGNLRQWPKKEKPFVPQKPKAVITRPSENSYKCQILEQVPTGDHHWLVIYGGYSDELNRFDTHEAAAEWGRNKLIEIERKNDLAKEKYEFTL